jgi:hypothetical protein
MTALQRAKWVLIPISPMVIAATTLRPAAFWVADDS